MLDRIFDLPLSVTCPGIIAALCLPVLCGLLLVRRHVLPRLRGKPEDSEFTGAVMQSVMVFYGLAVALMAVNVSETYNDVSKIVSSEATALAVVYRGVSSYPEPARQRLRNELRGYVEYIIHDAWPRQQQGKSPQGGVERINSLQDILTAFEPVTEGQKLLHGETLRAWNEMIFARRLRLDAVNTGLSGVMWIVVAAGAFIALSVSWFFKVEDGRLHGALVFLLSAFVGLVIFMILALDRPFRGELGLSSEPYQLILRELMTDNR
ncbi:MAG: hypothetical protein JWM59_1950 [Verrucomicrobiales bacterium]|nr:hypothetical protein [Verrucomicrobiales bacterium]